MCVVSRWVAGTQLGVNESYELLIPGEQSGVYISIMAPTVWGALRALETFRCGGAARFPVTVSVHVAVVVRGSSPVGLPTALRRCPVIRNVHKLPC